MKMPDPQHDDRDSGNADTDAELAAVHARYARRSATSSSIAPDPRYSLMSPAPLRALQERQRAMQALFNALGWRDLSTLRLIEVGSGAGGNLLECLWLGFAPERVCGIELLAERHAAARARLPAGVSLLQGDALSLLPSLRRAEIVLQSTVFSSLLDDAFQQRLAAAMWAAALPGGGVLWYDFTVDNPRNPDVRGVPLARVRALFPHGRITTRRVTLAPPISRRVCRVHPAAYGVFNLLPFLRTHVLCWIQKP